MVYVLQLIVLHACYVVHIPLSAVWQPSWCVSTWTHLLPLTLGLSPVYVSVCKHVCECGIWVCEYHGAASHSWVWCHAVINNIINVTLYHNVLANVIAMEQGHTYMQIYTTGLLSWGVIKLQEWIITLMFGGESHVRRSKYSSWEAEELMVLSGTGSHGIGGTVMFRTQVPVLFEPS